MRPRWWRATGAAAGLMLLAGCTKPMRGGEGAAPPLSADTARPSGKGCSGWFVNVTVAPAPADSLVARARALLEPVRSQVRGVEYSPAISAFRVAVADSASAALVMAHLNAAPGVRSAEADGCGLRIMPER